MVMTGATGFLTFVLVAIFFQIQSTCAEVCSTPGCVKAANNLLDSMDTSMNPCDNFFGFACGNWIKDNPIPDDKSSFSSFTMVRERVSQQVKSLLSNGDVLPSKVSNMAKIVYNACMDTDLLTKEKSEPLIGALQLFGGWPLLDSKWSGEKLDMVEFFGKLRRDYGMDLFVDLSVSADWKNVTNTMLSIDQGSLGLGAGTRDYFLNDTLYSKQMKAYRQLILDHIELLAADMKLQMNPKMMSDVDEILSFERQLANITVPEENRRNASLLYNRWTMEELSFVLPFINWNNHFNIIMPSAVYNFARGPTFSVNVNEPGFMRNLQSLLKQTDKRIVVNYMLWRLIKRWSVSLDKRFDDIFQTFSKEMYGRKEKPLAWKRCVSVVSSLLDKAVGAIYVREHFKKEDKSEALQMIGNIKKTFAGLVGELDWMDATTKQRAIEKADEMIEHIGYPDFALNDTALDEYYHGLDIKTSDNFFNAIKKLYVWIQNDDFNDLLKPFDRKKFVGGPAEVNAYYSSERNAIIFPAGILQPPFFRGDFPKSVNYGAMGAVIGHELTHGFDDQGSQFDKIGNLHDWWSESASKNFRQKTKCIIDQYSNYTVKEINMKVNGKLTQGENIADNGGVKQAFLAYKKYIQDSGTEELRLPGLQNFTNDQIFFLSFANFWCGQTKSAAAVAQLLTDPHSPYMFRIIGSLVNFQEFSNAFMCPIGSTMNPDPSQYPKCTIW